MPALELGLRPGQRLADARARAPHLDSTFHEPEKDASALRAMASWAERWSPWVAPAPPDGLFLDVSGIAHLFGSEARLIADMQGRFLALGYTARFGIAGTLGAAWALARFAPAFSPGSAGWREALSGLPVEALRLESETVTTLRRLGLKTIRHLCAIPRRDLARRFRGTDKAQQVLLRLDQARGLVDEPLSPLRDPPQFSVRQCLEEPLSSAEGIGAMLDDLAEKLCLELARASQGATRLALAFFRSDGSRATVKAGLSLPSRNPVHVSRLLKPKLDGLDAGFGIDAMSLAAEETGPIEAGNPGFLAGPDRLADGFAELSDRIANRHEEARIARLLSLERHWPEWAERLISPASALPPQKDGLDRTRPLTLFDSPEEISVMAEVPDGPPVRFAWRRMRHRVRRCEGPERIAPEWWRPSEKTRRSRDYYVVEDEEGRRFWLFREGIYGEDRKPAPRWFLHGLLP